MRVTRVCSQTVGLIRHTPLAICRLEVSDTRGAAAEVVISEDVHLAFGLVNPDPLHDMKQRFHIVKMQYSEVRGKMTGPYCRAVVLWILQNGFEVLAWKGKPLCVYGEGWQLAPQWCSVPMP